MADEQTRRAAIQELARRELARREQSKQQAPINALSASAEGAQSGMMLGFDDEIGGAMLAPIEATKNWWQGDGFDLKKGYRTVQQGLDARKQQRRESNPIASTVGEIAGGLSTAGGATKSGLTLMGRMGPVKAATVEGATYGGLVGAGEADPGERTKGAVIGGVTGAGTGLLASKIGGAIMNRAKGPKTQGSDALKQQANALYDASEQVGVNVKGKALKRAVGNMKLKLAPQIKNERLYGETRGIIDYLDDQAKSGALRLRDIDELRQVVGDSIADASRREKRTLVKVKDALDDFVMGLKPGDVTGDVRTAGKHLKDAREMYSRFSRQEVVEEVIEKAKNQATGFENGLRVHFRAIANNPKKMKQFTKAEQDAIRKIVRGGPVENLMRAFAWMSPQKTIGAVGTGIMAAEGGLGPASALATGGMAATKAAERATMGNVGALEQLIQGINPAQLPMAIRQAFPALSQEASREMVLRSR